MAVTITNNGTTTTVTLSAAGDTATLLIKDALGVAGGSAQPVRFEIGGAA